MYIQGKKGLQSKVCSNYKFANGKIWKVGLEMVDQLHICVKFLY